MIKVKVKNGNVKCRENGTIEELVADAYLIVKSIYSGLPEEHKEDFKRKFICEVADEISPIWGYSPYMKTMPMTEQERIAAVVEEFIKTL